MKYQFEILPAKGEQWYWRLKSRNGRIIARSETYRRKSSAEKIVRELKEAMGYEESS